MSANGLDPFRRRLDEIDERLARLLGERFQICREVAIYKSAHDVPMMQPGRVAEVRARYLARGAEVDLPADFTAALFELLIGATCKLEDEIIERLAAEREPSGSERPSSGAASGAPATATERGVPDTPGSAA